MKAVINLQITSLNRRILSCLLAVILIFSYFGNINISYGITNTTPFPELGAEAAIVIDATTGKILFEQKKDVALYPASTTKLMTALLAVENLDPLGEVVIDKETANVGEASMNLKEGEIITVENLLKGLLYVSGNDAAVALAKAVSNDTATFAALMTERAKELGAKNTNFVNPNGLHEDQHYTTAYDMALIAQAALKEPVISNIVSKASDTIPPTNLTEERVLRSTNQLLRDTPYKYEGANGMKTGYTPEAGNCLVASAKKGSTQIITVVLKSSELGRFADSTILLNYAFENYKTVMPISKGQKMEEVKVRKGAVNKVMVAAKEDVAATLPINASEDLVTTKLVLDKKVKAPIKKGQTLGEIEIFQVGEKIGTVDAIATESVAEGGILSYIGIEDKTAKVITIILIVVLVLLILLLWIYIVLKRREIRRKKQRRLERERARKTPQEEAWEAWFNSDVQRRKPTRY